MGLFGQRTIDQLRRDQSSKALEAEKEFDRNTTSMMLDYLPLSATEIREKEARFRASLDDAIARWVQTKSQADYDKAVNASWWSAMLTRVLILRRKMISAGWQEPE